MFPGKRGSVTYDANRIRSPPETLSDRSDRSDTSRTSGPLRVVSDDIVQRQSRHKTVEYTPVGESPDSFDFREPLAASFSDSTLSSPHSPVFRGPAVASSAGSGSTPSAQQNPNHAVSFRHDQSNTQHEPRNHNHQNHPQNEPAFPQFENPGGSAKMGLSRSVSRVRSQFPPNRRYSSLPTATKNADLAPQRSTPSPGHDSGNISKAMPQTQSPPPLGNSFSFSEADDSVLQVSPARTQFATAKETFHFGVPRAAPQTAEPQNRAMVQSQEPLIPQSLSTATVSPPYPVDEQQASPPKSITSINSNAIGSIISTYEHSSSSLALNEPKSNDTRTYPLSTPAFQNAPVEKYYPCEGPSSGFKQQPSHDRQDSQSSNISSTSSSTLTSSHNHQQRFVRYVMSTQASSSSFSSRWVMDNVLIWLDMHGFPESWKETFRRNEISGNRFLELGNYDSSSVVWRQLSQTLGPDGSAHIVDRFISLLGSETQDLEVNAGYVPSQALSDAELYNKLENRKSSSTLWTQQAPTIPTKQRPFSYIDPGNPKPPKEHVKFFRKHNRLMSGETAKETQSKSTGEASSGSNNLGFKKSGILSTLRKYGGEKAAGIVKQVHSNPSSSKQSKRLSSTFPNVLQKKDHGQKSPDTSFTHRQGSQGSLPIYVDEAKSPNSVRSLHVVASEESMGVVPVSSSKSWQKVELEDLVSQEFLPVSIKTKKDEDGHSILLTRDNIWYVPCTIDSTLLSDLTALKKMFLQKLEMLDIGTITYHLTDFNASYGAALPDELLASVLSQGLVSKLRLEQNFGSPNQVNTFSSTSSDSKSFDTSGGNMYPATPQYMLQQTGDKSIDYMNFKEMCKNRQPSNPDIPPMFANSDRIAGPYPMNLTIPQSKRLNSAGIPNLNKRGLPLINTSQPVALGPSSAESKSARDSSKQSPSSFSVVRREGREIDFDKRRLNSTENKAPRLIPNIYSSSVTDSAISPISASTIHSLKEEKSTSPSATSFKSGVPASRALSSASDLEKGSSFVARRKAPPPPTASNSLKVSKKKSTSSLGHSIGSTRSEYYNFSSDSIDSFRSSQANGSNVQPAKKFDFSDAPSLELPGDNEQSDDEVFFKPLPRAANAASKDDLGLKNKEFPGAPSLGNELVPESMTMRPSVDELYDNLERYFPNTILDKPIIDAYPDSPSTAPIADHTSKPLRKPPISRTFSNANLSPVHPEKESDDQVFYGDGPRLRRRMKTIRAVANEAHRKRLASQKAVKESAKQFKEHVAQIGSALARTNTKLWGQKVVEVTSDDIEKGFVGRIRKVANKSYEEFAWVKGELIGRGSFGSVFLALNVTTGEMLAVKQVNVSESQANSDGVDAFHKEVETMKDLDHLNIVQYLGFEQSKQTYSLFLEYVAGGSVSSCLKSYGKFDEPLVKFITRQVLEGLKYLHENGILHRDLKADNLLLEIDGVCKISDFGISKRSQDIYSNNAEMSMQGTVFWMAPEVIHSMVEEKKQGYSAKVDIWSLGCVMLEMFAGQRPWSNEAVVSAIYKLGKTKLAPPIPTDISQEARDFLNKCFTIDSEKRPTAAELLKHEFMQVDSGFQFHQTRLSEIIKSNSTRMVNR